MKKRFKIQRSTKFHFFYNNAFLPDWRGFDLFNGCRFEDFRVHCIPINLQKNNSLQDSNILSNLIADSKVFFYIGLRPDHQNKNV
jgi:hypothetical protein